MTHKYYTYVNENQTILCQECGGDIKQNDDFAVVTTASKPGHVNCLNCTDIKLSSKEQVKMDSSPGKVSSGTARK